MNCPQCAARMSPYRADWAICYGCGVVSDAGDDVAEASPFDRAGGSASTVRRAAAAPRGPSLGGFDAARAAVAHA